MPQTKTQAGGKKARLLWYFLRGSKRFYLAAVLCSVCITFLDMLTPQLIRITIDNVLGQLPLNVPPFWSLRGFGWAAWKPCAPTCGGSRWR